MDPHLLRTYVTVARLASFSAAARALGYTQSAVSQQVAALEQDLDTPLLTRRPVAPTRAGERLLEHAGPLLLRLDAARAEVLALAGEPDEGLTLAAAPTALTPRTLRALPSTGVTLRVVDRAAVPEAVAAGAAHLGLVDGLAAPTDPLRVADVAPLTTRGAGEEPVCVLLPAGHPLARRAGLRLGDLADARWLDAPGTGLPLDQLRAATGRTGFRPALRYDGTDVRTLIALVAAGHGLALLPRSAAPAGPATGARGTDGASGPGDLGDSGDTGDSGGAVAVPLTAPRVVHRTELLHTGALRGAAAAFAARLDITRS
ncbi:LysR family transcriptional regulator [Streptomyces spectabilis]|uniref:DNA-binding transcriptional LysR family regulator n=1 Tax=Streptomyces spectabilis TaxID=68270 RepID=A0A5P2XKD6_STRST|nr:LysR family transcriptional regulator [Streptomyces spectabilis]MBB5105100.1 DNA-binding transcriptional LysR family regulator [Streptomyces spectabilis]MCI3905828.1 LysR family transcriptional regulator [Streptomyces spectabilis]QEV65031.1 LysR family transcriptional regulator [Streptomyces spectabilis]